MTQENLVRFEFQILKRMKQSKQQRSNGSVFLRMRLTPEMMYLRVEKAPEMFLVGGR